MTDIEKKALALLNEICVEMGLDKVRSLELDMPGERALLRAIEQHEAFKREVSDAIDSSVLTPETEAHLSRFIIPKTDPLVEAIHEVDTGPIWDGTQDYANKVRAAMKARGYEWRKIQEQDHD